MIRGLTRAFKAVLHYYFESAILINLNRSEVNKYFEKIISWFVDQKAVFLAWWRQDFEIMLELLDVITLAQ